MVNYRHGNKREEEQPGICHLQKIVSKDPLGSDILCSLSMRNPIV